MSATDLAELFRALEFATHKHRLQKRKNAEGTPYIVHPLDVSKRLASPPSSLASSAPAHLDVLIAALLHDTVEDTETTHDELVQTFGEKVASIVAECTDDKSLHKMARKQAQIDTAASKSWEARNVKLADKLSNLTDLTQNVPVGWTSERVQEYFEWAKRVTDQCADANLGLAGELETLYKDAYFMHEGQRLKCHPSCS